MSKFENLTKYLHKPTDDILDTVNLFIDDVYDFIDNSTEYGLRRYIETLRENGIETDRNSIANADASSMSAECVLALIMATVRAERFCEDTVLSFFEDGSIYRWLARLEFLDGA